MSAPSISVRSGAPVHAAAANVAQLRRLRRLCIAVAVACAAMLPFSLGVLQPSALPFIGSFYPQPPRGIVAMSNFPRTAVVGQTERFSVRLPSHPHALLTYILQYPDGHQERATLRSDAHGYSSHTFRIVGYRPHQFREVATIGVQDATGAIQAYLDFAIQKPRR